MRTEISLPNNTTPDVTDNTSYIHRMLEEPWGSGNMLIASHAEDIYGNGNLLKVPYEELVALFVNKDDGLMVACDTTEGMGVFEVYDLCFIGDLREWAKEHNITISYLTPTP